MSEAWSDIIRYFDATAKVEASKAASQVLFVMGGCALMYAFGMCVMEAKIRDLGQRVESLEKKEGER